MENERLNHEELCIMNSLHRIMNYGDKSYQYFLKNYVQKHNPVMELDRSGQFVGRDNHGLYIWKNKKTGHKELITSKNDELLKNEINQFTDDEMSGKIPYMPEFIMTGHCRYDGINPKDTLEYR